MPRLLLALLLVLVTSTLTAGPFWVRNTDPGADFLYWTVPGPVTATADPVLAALPLAPGGLHRVGPGERVRVDTGPGAVLVGVFLPPGAGYLTPLAGGWIPPSALPAQGTLLVDRPSLTAATRGRSLEAPLQAWGLVPPRFTLDGRADDWAAIPFLAEWGPAFRPTPGPWPAGRPLPVALQAVQADGALWVRFVSDRPWSGLGPQTSVSLVLRRPGALLEWPLTGIDGALWSWTDGANPVAAGSLVRSGTDLEARLCLDRLTAADRAAWSQTPSAWALVVSEGASVRSYDLGAFSWGDLP